MATYVPGDCLINSLTISGSGGSVDVTYLMQYLDIYEDITVPGINCQLTLLESSELHDYLPLIGEEYLSVDFNSPGLKSFTHKFYLTSMQNVTPSPNMKNKVYLLTGVAPEVLKHKTTLVNKMYNTQNSDMVQDIFNTYLASDKSIDVEETQGTQQYNVANKKPFVAIMDILARSVSVSHESSSYLFFENQKGYHFETMEKLCEQSSSVQFTNYEVVSDTIFHNNFRNILGYSLPDAFKVAEKMGVGAYATVIKKYDFGSLIFGTKTITPDVKSMSRTMPNLFSSQGFSSQWQNPGSFSFVPKDDIKPDTSIDEMLPKRAAYAAEMDQLRLVIRIYGDSTLTAGDVVNVMLMMNSSDTGTRLPDTLLSGNYLVSKVTHIILPYDARPMYTQVLELISGGYASSV